MSTSAISLPPAHDREAAIAWVDRHLADVVTGPVTASPRFRGGQLAADAALAGLDVTGYAGRRNEVWPLERRGASALSPYVRHGLLDLPTVWDAVADAPTEDRQRFRDELLWQEHARHLYARVGDRSRQGLRRGLTGQPWRGDDPREVWSDDMACLAVTVDELVRDGYLVNQTRMWLASHWAIRQGVDWRAGEDVFFRHLLDGSRAANRAGWQWTVGTATGRPYGFSRWQVEKRAPGLCDTCPLAARCPIQDWPEDPPLPRVHEPERLRHDPDPAATRGPTGPPATSGRTGAPATRDPKDPATTGDAEVVWLTAESLGDTDPALAAHPELPAAFVFDRPLLARLRLSGKRLVFLVETLADLAERRELEVHVGAPTDVLAGRRLAATFAPVPGWRRRAAALDIATVHPWRWLVAPHGGSVASFSAWRKAAGKAEGLPG